MWPSVTDLHFVPQPNASLHCETTDAASASCDASVYSPEVSPVPNIWLGVRGAQV